MSMPRTLYDKIWDDHVIETAGGTSLIYIDRHLVHEVTSPQAFEGLRMAGPQSARAGKDARRRRPQHPDHRPQRRHRRSGEPPAGRASRAKRARVRHRILRRVRCAAGHRPHHRPGAGLHPAGDDDRVRRQPHLDPRRLRRARPRDRHLRGRACARDPDADPDQGQEHAGQGRRRASRRRHRQGHHPRHHRRDRHGGRHRPRDRILRLGDRGALDGRADDGLQHVDRGGRPRRHDRARREDLRLSEGPAEVAEGRFVGSGAALLGHAS